MQLDIMKYLAIDTSGPHLTVIAKGAGGEYTYFNGDCNLKHSVTLMSAVDEALGKAGMAKEDVDVFCCVVGPGSFTGIRIGISTVKALSYALGKRVLGVTSFDVLAYNSDVKRTAAIVDARHGHVYAEIRDGSEVVFAPSYIAVEELKAYEGYEFVAAGSIEGLDTAGADLAAGLKRAVEAKLPLACEDAEVLVPLYIRKSQAEEGR